MTGRGLTFTMTSMAFLFSLLAPPKDLTLKEQSLRARALLMERRRNSRKAGSRGILALPCFSHRTAVSSVWAPGHLLKPS